MIYQVYKPKLALHDVVDHYWYSKVSLEGSVLQNYPTPLLQGLIFNFERLKEHHSYEGQTIELYRSAYMFGQPVSYREVKTNPKGIHILGVKFTLLGIARVTGIDMKHIANTIIAAEDIWGGAVESLCDRMQSAVDIPAAIEVLEQFLYKKYLGIKLHYRIENTEFALSLIEKTAGLIDIRRLQYETNTSRKTLERAFSAYVGVMPKLYSRIIRFNALKEHLDKCGLDEPLARLAYDYGFSDGSHLSAEFKHFSNMMPTEYVSALPVPA